MCVKKFGDIACECLLHGHGHGIVMAFTYYPDINEYQESVRHRL